MVSSEIIFSDFFLLNLECLGWGPKKAGMLAKVRKNKLFAYSPGFAGPPEARKVQASLEQFVRVNHLALG